MSDYWISQLVLAAVGTAGMFVIYIFARRRAERDFREVMARMTPPSAPDQAATVEPR